VVTAKYKVYIVLLFIFIALLSLVYIPEANDSYKSSQTSYNQVKANLDNLKASIKEAQEDMDYLCNKKN
jgi:CHASE3 domain sensor protein